MSLQHELSNLVPEALVDTFDARVVSAGIDDVDASLRQAEAYSALMTLCAHAADKYAREDWVSAQGGEADNPELRGFRTGAMTVLITLMQYAEAQALAAKLGL